MKHLKLYEGFKQDFEEQEAKMLKLKEDYFKAVQEIIFDLVEEINDLETNYDTKHDDTTILYGLGYDSRDGGRYLQPINIEYTESIKEHFKTVFKRARGEQINVSILTLGLSQSHRDSFSSIEDLNRLDSELDTNISITIKFTL